ncbi:MAG: hypothetical protein ABJE10_09870 [bacterium]
MNALGRKIAELAFVGGLDARALRSPNGEDVLFEAELPLRAILTVETVMIADD